MEEAKGARTTLGFHQFFDSDLLSKREQAAFTGVDRIKDQYVVGVLIEYLIEMKIHTDLYTVASETPPGEMHFLTNEEAVRFGVVEGDQPFKQAALQDSIGYQWQILPYGDGLRLELSAGDRGERIFCMTREPNMVHVQLLRRTPDGSTFVDTDYASGDLRDYLGNIHKPSAELESGAIVPVVFGGLFGDSEGDFSFLLDLKFSLEAFHQLSRDTSFVIMPQDEPEHGPASVRTGSGVLLMDVLSGVLPHNGRSDLLKLMRKNCA
ncbi:hypothetical protein TP2_17820 [Thioclava pacifica DSM 10166]|uniref:Uncharacterized protein n=2 Tax=Thioclava pacifica TaxID=285109 RepID=A0A074JA76_9RHOB|nr:hypothetical protein TP2_17820 [Thioclava pacifica DSM 10166]